MLDVLEAVCETRKPATIPYVDDRTAKAERLKFYGLVRALVVNKHSLAEDAQKLEFRLSGITRNAMNIMTIQFAVETATDQFYSAVAARLTGEQ